MRRLGISIYPEKSDKQTILNYIDKAAAAGFSRIFSCLLSVEKSKLALFLDSWNERYWEIQKRYFAAVRYSGDAAGI